MRKSIWIFLLILALAAAFNPLEGIGFTVHIFGISLLVGIILYNRLVDRENHWVDRVSPLVGIIIGIGGFVLFSGVLLFVGNVLVSFDSVVLQHLIQVAGRLLIVLVGIYLFVITMASFMAGATRRPPSSFFKAVLIGSAAIYGVMLILGLMSSYA